jgi:hypothetical protein
MTTKTQLVANTEEIIPVLIPLISVYLKHMFIANTDIVFKKARIMGYETLFHEIYLISSYSSYYSFLIDT